MSAEFFNEYLEFTMMEVLELTKQRIASKARMSQLEKLVAAQAQQIEDLQKALDKANSKKKKEPAPAEDQF